MIVSTCHGGNTCKYIIVLFRGVRGNCPPENFETLNSAKTIFSELISGIDFHSPVSGQEGAES